MNCPPQPLSIPAPFLHLPLMTILFLLLSEIQSPSLGPSFLFIFLGSVGCIMGILSLWLISMYQWVHAMYVVWGLGYLTQNNIFVFHPFACKIHDVLVFNSWIVFHCVNEPHFLYPLFCWGTSGLFLAFGYDKQGCYEHSRTHAPLAWWGKF